MYDRAACRVGVIVPVYRAAFLGEALESVFAQSHPADEVVVIDDGSPDRELLNRAVARFADRVTLIRQANAGAGAARNAGLAVATADFVAFLDADDRWQPTFLASQMAFLARSAADMVYADATVMGDTPAAGRTFMAMCPSRGAVTLESLLAQECNVLTSTVVVRRSLVMDAGLFDADLRRGQDFDLWLRLVARGAQVRYQPDVLAVRRLHGDNLSGTRFNELERALHVFGKAIRTLPLSARERRAAEHRVRELEGDLAREQGKERLAVGDFTGARRSLEEASRVVPSWKLKAARLGLILA
ncbi:MAG: glycosyltransferase family 2 protein, partial [Vicinamibacterales bacterium]